MNPFNPCISNFSSLSFGLSFERVDASEQPCVLTHAITQGHCNVQVSAKKQVFMLHVIGTLEAKNKFKLT